MYRLPSAASRGADTGLFEGSLPWGEKDMADNPNTLKQACWSEGKIGMHILSKTFEAISQVTRNQALLMHIPNPLFALKQDGFSRPSFM